MFQVDNDKTRLPFRVYSPCANVQINKYRKVEFITNFSHKSSDWISKHTLTSHT